jgi:hypothetical protein
VKKLIKYISGLPGVDQEAEATKKGIYTLLNQHCIIIYFSKASSID